MRRPAQAYQQVRDALDKATNRGGTLRWPSNKPKEPEA